LPITSSAHRRRSARRCADEAARPLSLDAPVRATDDTTMAAMLGSPDSAYTHVEDVEMLRPVLGGLSERARRVLAMRFADGLTQSEIAKRVGCSQMHIYRILRGRLIHVVCML
jgi:RNA polymerase sigma-B factor